MRLVHHEMDVYEYPLCLWMCVVCARYLRSHHLTEAWWAAVRAAGWETKQHGTFGMSAKEHGMTAKGMMKIHQTRKTGSMAHDSRASRPLQQCKIKLIASCSFAVAMLRALGFFPGFQRTQKKTSCQLPASSAIFTNASENWMARECPNTWLGS